MSAAGVSAPSTRYTSHVKHHAEFWFDDGSIVLVARDVGFRVYRGLLTSQSTVFADMLVASTSGADEILDGCPVIPLVDSPHDLAHLLRVLLPTSPAQPPQPSSFEDLSAVIRLADKYHIQSAQDQAVHALQQYHFTSDFAAFCGPPDTTIVVEPIHAIGAVNLARLTDTPRILPLALYKCCLLDDETLRAGWKHADGTVEHLAPADLERCFAARAPLVALYASLYTQVLNVMPTDSGDGSTLGCMWFSGFVSSELLHALLTKRMGYNVFPDGAKVLERLLAGTRQPCWGCVGDLVRKTEVARRRLWDALPEIFGVAVEGWKSTSHGSLYDAAGTTFVHNVVS